MKRLFSIIAVVALGVSIAPQADAATSVQGAPLTGISLAKSTDIHLVLTGYPMSKGLYIEQAVKPAAGARPATSGTALWVSAASKDIAQGATSITTDLVLKVDNGHSWGADCAHQECGIFIRLDHNSPGDLSEDQFIPLAFDASTAPTAATPAVTSAPLPADTLDVKVAGNPVPLTIAYETPITFDVKTGSGLAATIKSYAPDLCPVNGNTVNALKGSGICDIGITAPGDAAHAAFTQHFPLTLTSAVQKLTTSTKIVKVGKSIALDSVTTFGEKIIYKVSSKNCAISGSIVKAVKVGACAISASAPGTENYSALSAKIILTVKK